LAAVVVIVMSAGLVASPPTGSGNNGTGRGVLR
jgi:hypothetical protein